MRITPLIGITNESTVLTDAEIKNAIPAMQNAIHYNFRPWWNVGAILEFFASPSQLPGGAWHMSYLDNSDQAGALGYHDETPTGMPLLKVFAGTDKQYGYDPWVTSTHEIFETLVDPQCDACAQVSQTQVYGYEVGDPVEADQYAFTHVAADGVTQIKISDFITPNWFQAGFPGPYDRQKVLTSPGQVSPGGYVSIGTADANGITWTQYQNQKGQLVKVTSDKDENQPRFRNRNKNRPNNLHAKAQV
jgi:hypothetical protein